MRDEERLESIRAKGELISLTKMMGTNDLTFRGLGVVFSRGEELGFKDFIGDRFLPDVSQMHGTDEGGDSAKTAVELGTDYGIGDWLVPGRSVPVTWDHGRGILGKKVLGEATFSKLTDEGLEFIIKITEEQAGRYSELVDWAYGKSILGLSSQSLATMYEYDYDTGIIKSWRIGELALTVTPADHRTRDFLEKAKSLGLDVPVPEENPMEDKTPAKNAEVPEEVTLNQNVQDAEVNAESEAETGETSFAAELNGVVEDFEADIDNVVDLSHKALSGEAVQEIAGMLESLSKRLGALEAMLDTLAKRTDIDNLSKRLDEEVTVIKNGVKDSFTNLTTSITKRVHGITIETLAEASAAELAATTESVPAKSKTGIPKGMPGQ